MAKQVIDSDTISEDSEFLMAYEIIPLRTLNNGNFLRVSYLLPTIPVVGPWVILPLVGMALMFYFRGPMFGSWGLSIGFICLGIIAGIGCLFMLQKFVVMPLREKRIRIVCNKRENILEIPPDNTMVSYKNIHSIVALHGWLHHQGQSALVSELSVIYHETGILYRSALFLTNKRKARKIGKLLADLTNSAFQEIKKKA